MRVGFGYDLHRFTPDRPLVLCGVSFAGHDGLLGHSDADAPVHALIDAMLGAAGMGDIGRRFPDTDERYRGISSIALLKTVVGELARAGFRVVNVDVTIVAQTPKIASSSGQMCANLAEAIGCPVGDVNVKGKTEEGLGVTGSGQALKAYAVCMLEAI